MHHWPFIFIITLLLSGCAAFSSKPEKGLSFSVQETWQTEIEGQGKITSPESLLDVLNSPQLLLLFQDVETSNFDLKIAASQLNSAAASAGIDASQLWPSIDINLQGSRTESDLVFRPESYTLEGALSWELDLWGKLRNQKNASKLSLEAAIANYEAARLSLAGNLAIAWFNYLGAHTHLNLAKRNLGVSKLTLNATEKRYKRGLVTSLDLSQARSAFATSNADLAGSKSNLASAYQSLVQIIGPLDKLQNTPRILKEIEEQAPELPTTLPAIPDTLPIDVVRSRPDIIAAERSYRAAVQLWRAAGKQALPSLGVTASAGFNSITFDGLGDANNKTNTVSGQLTTPFFYFGRVKNQTKQAGSQAEEQFQTYNKTVFEALLEIQQNMDSDLLLSQQLDAQNNVSVESKRALDIAYRDYNDGLTSINTVINAEQDFITSQRNFINLNTQRLQQRVQLLLALGGSVPNIENTLLDVSE